MSDKMTDSEFADKIDYEGGIFEAFLGYGLRSSDLEDHGSSLYAAVLAFEDVVNAQEFQSALENLKSEIEELVEEQ